MAGIQIEKHVNAPPEKVFARAVDFANAADFIQGISRIEMLSEGPVGVGTRFRETRTMFKKDATEEMEVTAFDAPNGYTLGCESHGCRYRSEFTFVPDGDGTKTTMSFEATPLTFSAKVMSFLTRPMMKMMAKECLKDLDDLKASVEAEHEASANAT